MCTIFLSSYVIYTLGFKLGESGWHYIKGLALLEIGTIIIMTKTASIYWVRTVVNITKRFSTGTGTAHGGAF